MCESEIKTEIIILVDYHFDFIFSFTDHSPVGPPESISTPNFSAAAVHGQLPDPLMRKPQRLASLTPVGPVGKQKKGKKKSHNALEPL